MVTHWKGGRAKKEDGFKEEEEGRSTMFGYFLQPYLPDTPKKFFVACQAHHPRVMAAIFAS